MLFFQNLSINIVYPNGNYPFVYVRRENKLDSCYEWSSSLWFPTKWKVEMLFSWNQSINIMYPNGNYPFLIAHHEKKLDCCHGRSSSRWFPTKRKVEILFSWNQSVNVMHRNGNYHFSLLVAKGNYILAINKVYLVDCQQNESLKCFFPETKVSISCISMGTTFLIAPS